VEFIRLGEVSEVEVGRGREVLENLRNWAILVII
jgi:hypothetical protein